MRMAHNLIVNYGMYKQMDVFVSRAALETPCAVECLLQPAQCIYFDFLTLCRDRFLSMAWK